MQEFEYLQMQLRLQRGMQEANPEAGTKDPYLMTQEELEQFIHWNFMALVKELGEATDEISWKPWASARFVNYPACIREMVDSWHFFMNIMLAMAAMAKVPVNELAREFQDYYQEKNAKNLQRQIEGYDGVSDKCPFCHREISITNRLITHAGEVVCCEGCAMHPLGGDLMSEAADRELQELQADIEQRSSQRPGSGTPQDLQDAAAAAHRTKQGATVDLSGSPAPGFKDPASLFMQARDRDAEEHSEVATAWDGLVNPHAMKMVLEAEQSGEPLFCFRARDFFSIQVIAFYANIVEQYGPDDAHFHNNIVDALGEFKEWQKDHIGEVRYPD